ncbi:MAG: SseB family protein [Rickettsiales bacterium]|nr:SseB family protein [Rickettsiales bacterium]
MEQPRGFNASDMVIVILSEEPDMEANTLSIQDFIIEGRPMIPVFTSAELFNEATDTEDFLYFAIEIQFGFFMSLMQGTETLVINPGTEGSYGFDVKDMTFQSEAP